MDIIVQKVQAVQEKKRMKANPHHTGSEEYNYFIAVLFPADQLKILPYNRVVFDLNGLSKADFMNSVAEKFTLQPTENKEPKTKNTFCMYIDKEWFVLKAKRFCFCKFVFRKICWRKT